MASALFGRRTFLAGLAGTGALALAGCSGASTTAPKSDANVVRIGHQTAGDLVHTRGSLEARLARLGFTVQWFRFASGPPLLEAMGAGAIDFGPAGETPPVYAQAAGSDFVYLANIPPFGGGRVLALVVPGSSPVRRLAEIRGKKIAYVQGSAAQYFLVKALAEVGLAPDDVEGVNLPPGDALTAFNRGDVDAWVTWDPYLIRVEAAGARVVRNAAGISTQGAYFLGTRAFAADHPEVVREILDEYRLVGEWAEAHPAETAKILASQMSLDLATATALAGRRRFTLRPIDANVLARQQQVADLFLKLGTLPRPVDVRQATLPPELYARVLPPGLRAVARG
jgi:sulfonate transport system substrate-binding protein